MEPYRELPVDRTGFIGEIPQIEGMIPCDNFALYTARKLYLHNAGHAILGYLGYLLLMGCAILFGDGTLALRTSEPNNGTDASGAKLIVV